MQRVVPIRALRRETGPGTSPRTEKAAWVTIWAASSWMSKKVVKVVIEKPEVKAEEAVVKTVAETSETK